MAPKEIITPPDSPEPPSHSFTLDDAKEFFDLVKGIAAMHNIPNGVNPHCHCSQAPLNSPAPQTSSPPVTREDLKQLLEAIQGKSTWQDSAKAAKDNKTEDVKPKKEIARASKLEFKTVNEVYVSNTSKMIKLTVSQLER